MQDESTSETEESPQETGVLAANSLPLDEEDNKLNLKKEPQIYLCDD